MADVIDLAGDGGVIKTILRQPKPGALGPSDDLPLVDVHYEGTLAESGEVFDTTHEDNTIFSFEVGKGCVIQAWDIALKTMKVGEIAKITCKPEYAYGSAGSPPNIPPNATLIFEVELVACKPQKGFSISSVSEEQASLEELNKQKEHAAAAEEEEKKREAKVEEEEQLQEEDDLQLQKQEQKKDDVNFGVREEEDDNNNLQLSKEGENEQLLEKQEDGLQLLKQEDDSNFQLPKEEEEQDDDVNNLQFRKEKDQLLQEQEDDLQLQKQEDENSNFELPKEEKEQQVPQDDLQVKQENDQCMELQEEEEEEQLQEGDDDLHLAKVEEEEKKDEADIGDGIERSFDNNTHHTQSDLISTDEREKLDNGLGLAQPSFPAAADANTVISEDTGGGGIDGNVEDMDDDSHVAEPHSPHGTATTADDDADIGVAGSEEDTAGDANMENAEDGTEFNEVEFSKGKRKRGKTQTKMKPTPPQRKKKDEEDVCFICYDGGSIVLCDRRGCPKAYHPACIKRDESFFQSKHKWNCDWHICSSCQKASHYMCYTCVYSLCKGCAKNADYVCVRGNKGFCGACMKTIMLIENVTVGDTELVQVDFDDKSSWEYLFKDYWIDLKAKLSLTMDELTKAKTSCKGDELTKAKNSRKGICSTGVSKEVSSGEIYNVDDEKDPSLENGGNAEANRSRRRKTKDQANILKKQNSLVMEDSDVDEVTPSTEGKTWATKELLEFVAHMRSGDTSMISQFDVQALLVEYIKKNNLRDPRQKSQIICDSRLRNLFGRPRVGHFEMLKLLENHFLIKEKSPADDIVRTGCSDAAGSEEEPAGSSDSRSDRRRKKRKRMEAKRSHINPNSEEYAAIDVHNINLLYLKRSLIENLMDDIENFHEMVVGSFVRIRISGGDQKQNMYRLVPVVGTSTVDESYKVGSRTTDFMLEILNLNKKETVSIDGISNQEFLEDECRRLRQSIKCGLVKRMKVGEIQEKAMALLPFKVNDWLQAEIARLNHLRDRASETGRRKELRECVEKLELLKSPRERQRRLHEIPDVHIDPNMDPNYESDEDAGDSEDIRQDLRSRSSSFGRRHLERNSSFREGDQNDIGNRMQKNLATAAEQSRSMSTALYVDRESKWSQGAGAFGLNNQNVSKSQLSPTGLPTSDWSSRAAVVRPESHPVVAPIAVPSPISSGRESFRSDLESEKMWHYQDPSGNIQGPFSIVQLRKWSAKGHFPAHFRVWRTNEKQENSILLTEALDGRLGRSL